ncbi:uncharacterized protein B0I36DRAFT_106865 [Microdochium trichocladiopsis]|uniref:Uncharacterized protein n=1 Tax=Microdochium trichocladiopsis TaxID=1682393 RepID=A0A9P8Y6X6_9PEZI|nr:uncharacterized protein B0I36DRAFT_106865 [Microdochium trichocladiopsis]KAH7033270.1 hypothetical protein B0I36DRAFT_106865 [Microdochium trichocladiopsis]
MMANRPAPHLRPTAQRGVPRPNLGHHGSSNLSNNSNSQINGHGGHSHAQGPTAPTTAATTTATNATTTTTTTNAGVRRNLFQSQLTRRPTPTSSASAETLRLDVDVLSDTSDIVVRDKNGEFDVGDPPTPPLEDPEDAGLDEAQENEQERRRLADAVKHHQINLGRMPAQPEEVIETLRASMRAQVASLAEDNWMYEAEELQRMQ